MKTNMLTWARRYIKGLKICGVEFQFQPPTEAVSNTQITPVNPNEEKDLKNVITDETISRSLVSGRPPSLLNCISAAPTLLIPESHKSSKHFFGLSTLLFIESSSTEKPSLLCYHRIINPGEPGSPERIGCSTLFHTSFNFRVTKLVSPIDHWMELAEHKPQEAIKEFLHIPGGTLLKTLNAYKWTIPQIGGTCEPFGVITRDLRASEGRIYTQYVFKMTLQFPEVSTTDDLKKLTTTFAPPCLHVLPLNHAEPEFFLTGRSPKPMDYLALRGLSVSTNWMSHDNAQFTRGFTIL